jgi:phosphatidate cytidylyltransferase
MIKRVITGAATLLILAAVILPGGDPLKAMVFVLIAVGMFEAYRAFTKIPGFAMYGGKINPAHCVGYAFAAVYLYFIDDVGKTNIMALILMSFMLALMTTLVLFHKRISVVDCAVTLFGFFYVAVLLSTVYLVREANRGEILVWLIFITAWGSDTGAYCVGKLFGKHKLIPSLSPKKTVEGAVGGVLTSIALSLIYGFLISRYHPRPLENAYYMYIFGAFGALGGMFSQFGDLTASAIKRYTDIKDFGTLLPGHGGVLDRFDSILFTGPAVYLVILAVI